MRSFTFDMRSRKVEIHGRVVDRIAADDDQHIDVARVHVRDQLAQAFDLVDGIGIERIGVDYGLAGVAQAQR